MNKIKSFFIILGLSGLAIAANAQNKTFSKVETVTETVTTTTTTTYEVVGNDTIVTKTTTTQTSSRNPVSPQTALGQAALAASNIQAHSDSLVQFSDDAIRQYAQSLMQMAQQLSQQSEDVAQKAKAEAKPIVDDLMDAIIGFANYAKSLTEEQK